MKFGKLINRLIIFRKQAVRVYIHKDAADFHLFGVAFKNQGQLNLAIKYLKMTIKIEPDNAEAHYDLGCIYLRQNKFNKAMLSFEKVLAINPDHVLAHEGKGIIFSKTGRGEDANHEFDSARELQI